MSVGLSGGLCSLVGVCKTEAQGAVPEMQPAQRTVPGGCVPFGSMPGSGQGGRAHGHSHSWDGEDWAEAWANNAHLQHAFTIRLMMT